jgi:septum formation protein
MGEPGPVRLILASSSLGRRLLLEQLGLPFEIMPADVPEPETGFSDPRTMVQSISWLKAAAVAARVDRGLVIAADTIGWLDGKPVLKPTDETDARRILRNQAGRVHELWTAVTIWRRPDDLQVAWQERSLVHFTSLSDVELEKYLATRTWRGCSGAYAVQQPVDPYVCVTEGSIANVIGLPLETLRDVLGWLIPQTASLP